MVLLEAFKSEPCLAGKGAPTREPRCMIKADFVGCLDAIWMGIGMRAL